MERGWNLSIDLVPAPGESLITRVFMRLGVSLYLLLRSPSCAVLAFTVGGLPLARECMARQFTDVGGQGDSSPGTTPRQSTNARTKRCGSIRVEITDIAAYSLNGP